MPDALRYLWQAFIKMRRRKGGGLAGPDPLSFPDMAGFIQLTGQRFAPWEVEVIERLDDLWLEVGHGGDDEG